MWNGFKMSSFMCKSHVHEMILGQKTCFVVHSNSFWDFLYLYTIIYEYENSPLLHDLSWIRLINFSHLNLFQVLFAKSSPTKVLFPFFGTPIVNEPIKVILFYFIPITHSIPMEITWDFCIIALLTSNDVKSSFCMWILWIND
jgi:hypothetical protein